MPEQRPGQRPGRRTTLTRADLPDQFTVEAVRELPIGTLRRLADHRNGILNDDEQRAFDQVVREVMRETAQRVSRRLTDSDWSSIQREDAAGGVRAGRPSSRANKQLDRIARRIGQQVDLAETLAPDVDWSFAQAKPALADIAPAPPAGTEATDASDQTDEQTGTVSDLEQRITEQVELVEVMSEIAEISKRTYGLEQQRDLQSTRTVFFGFIVSVAVLVAGWAPLVAAPDWTERLWIIGLTVGTCAVGGAAYGLVRRRQNRRDEADEGADDTA